jgi:hypothetical protein
VARKPPRRLQDAPSRISVQLDSLVHQRLRALVLVRSSSIQDLVAGWIEREVSQVRLPSVGGAGSADDAA